MTENNPNYNGIAQAINTGMALFNAQVTAVYEHFAAAGTASQVDGLVGSYKFFGNDFLNERLLPGVSVVAAYNSADEDLQTRATINAFVSETIALGVEWSAGKTGVKKVVEILTGASVDLYLNKSDIDFYGWGTSKLALFGLATSDYYYVKEYQRGETTFYEAYDSGKQELHYGTEGYETTNYTTLKLNFGKVVTKVICRDDGNMLEIDLRAKEWKLIKPDGTEAASGSLLEGTPDTMDAASEAIISQMYDDFKAELQLRDPNVNLEPLDTSVTNLVTHENVAKSETPEKDSILWGDFHIYHNKSENLSEFGSGDVSIVKDNAVGNVFIQAKDPETGYVSMVAYDGITGLNVLHYADPEYGGAITAIPVTDISQLTDAQKATFLAIIAAGNQARLDGGSELISSSPTLYGNLASILGTGVTTDDMQELVDGAIGKATDAQGNRDVSDPTQLQDLPDSSSTKSFANQGSTIDLIPLTDAQRIDHILNDEDQFADARQSQFWTLYNKVMNEGTLTTLTDGSSLRSLPSGVYAHTIDQGGGKTVNLLKTADFLGGDDIVVGVHTAFEGSYQAEVTEILNADNGTNSNLVVVTTTDTTNNVAFDSNTMTLKYPENFVYSEVGGYVGNLIGQQLADGNAFQNIAYTSVLKTLGQHGGTLLDFLAADNTVENAFHVAKNGQQLSDLTDLQSRPDIFTGFVQSFTNVLVSTVASEIVGEITDIVDIGGVGGEVINTVGNAVTVQLIDESLDFIFKGLDGSVWDGLFDGNFDGISIDPVGLAASFVARELAGEIITPESEVAAVFGSVGSTVGGAVFGGTSSVIGETVVSKVTSLALQKIFGLSGSVVPVIGTAIGVFIGTVLGTVLGNAIGGDQEKPESWGRVSYDTTADEYQIFNVWENGDAGTSIGQSLAQQVVDGVNSILAATQGTLRKGATAQEIQIGMEGNEFNVLFSGGESRSFGTGADAVNYAAFKLLKSYDLVGGNMLVTRAWHNSDADNIFEFKDDIEVAEAFQQYLSNPAGILAMMMDQPDSDTAQAWAAILQRAAELELHLPHEKDLDGGWAAFLDANGLATSLIPDLTDDTITLTDPVTGEETVLHHVIGPGYEIVRIEGTDGNDIIEVIVDGPSITYVAAGDGDDTIEGSDQSDILYGGGGDDIINGHEGNDWLHGGSGSDQIDGGLGEDLIIGAEHDDILIGGDNVDEIYGNDGDDHISAGDGMSDYLFGGAGNDTLEGNLDPIVTQNAYLYGQEGNDHLVFWQSDIGNGGMGDDLIEFKAANSSAHVTRGEGHDTIIASATGKNYLAFDNTISPNELYFKQDGDDLVILVLGEDQSVTIQNFFGTGIVPNIDIYALYAFELDGRASILDAVALDATIPSAPTGQYNYLSEADILAGQDDFEYLTNPNASLQYVPWTYSTSNIGGDGNDTINLGPGTAYGIGGAGNDTIQSLELTSGYKIYAGDSGDDYLFSNESQVAIMSGGLGNDLIDGSFANDRIYGGYGDDRIHPQNGDDIVYGGAGNDEIYGLFGSDTHYGDDGDDYIEERYGANTIHGGNGDDVVNASFNTDNDSIYGEAGNDFIVAGSGDDTINGGTGSDSIKGGSGQDWLYGDDDDDHISGDDGDDIISGGAGNNILLGGAGNDKVYGGQQNDILDGGDGDDVLQGDSGDDTYVIGGAQSNLTLNPSSNTGYARLDNASMPVDGFTISLRFRNGSAVSDDKLFHYATPEQLEEIKLYNTTSGIYWTIGGVQYNTGRVIQDNDWHDITLSWDSASGEAYMYEDGQLVYSHVANPGVTLHSGGVLMLGQYQNAYGSTDGSFAFNGDFKSFTIWDHALSSAEIVIGGNVTQALHHYDFNEGQGSTVTDQAGNGDATLIGDYAWTEMVAVDAAYLTGIGTDTILDTSGQDTISFGNDIALSDLTFDRDLADPDNLQINLSGAHILTINNHFNGGEVETLAFADGSSVLLKDVDVFISGGAGNDVIDGTDQNDVMSGGDGDDVLTGGSGNDGLDGGAGVDEAIFSGIYSNYTLDGTTITDDVGSDGIDTLTSIERLIFADGVYENGVFVPTGGSPNTAPVASDDSYSGEQDTDITGNVLTNDSDADGDVLSVTAETIATAHGSVELLANGNFTYTPDAGYVGADSFSYTVLDGNGGSDTGSVSFDLTAFSGILGTSGNDNLTGSTGDDVIHGLGGNDFISGEEGNDTLYGDDGDDTLKGRDGADIFYGGDGDDYLEGNNGDDVLYGGLGADTLKGSADVDTFAYLSADEGGDTILDFNPGSGEKIDLTAVLSSAPGFVDTNAFTDGYLRVAQNGVDVDLYLDMDGSAGGGAETLLATLLGRDVGDITLSAFILPASGSVSNTAPVAGNDSFSGTEDADVLGNVLGNDSDADGDSLSVSAGTFSTAHGSVVVSGNGDFTYTPDANYNGTDSFTYTLLDGSGGSDTGSVSLTLAAVNDNPVANDDSASIDQDMTAIVNVLSNDNDIDGDNMTVSVVTAAAFGALVVNADQTVTYTPDAGYTGADSFTYQVSDGNGGTDTATVSLTVNAVATNTAPVAADDSFTGDQDANITGNLLADNGNGVDSDPDGDTLGVTAETIGTTNGSVDILADGNFTYTPNAGYTGSDSFTYTLLDGNGGSDTGAVSLTLNAITADILGTSSGETLTGTTGDDIIRGLGGNDFISGEEGNDTLYGDDGDDTLKGRDGDDIFYGGDGDDYLEGNSGNDILYGGLGADTLKGSAGVDTFVFTSMAEVGDTINDYNPGSGEVINIADLLSGYDPLADAITDFVQITDDGTDSTLKVDSDGGADTFVTVATLLGVTGITDEAALETAGNLIAA